MISPPPGRKVFMYLAWRPAQVCRLFLFFSINQRRPPAKNLNAQIRYLQLVEAVVFTAAVSSAHVVTVNPRVAAVTLHR